MSRAICVVVVSLDIHQYVVKERDKVSIWMIMWNENKWTRYAFGSEKSQ